MKLKLSCTIVMFVLWEWDCGHKAFAIEPMVFSASAGLANSNSATIHFSSQPDPIKLASLTTKLKEDTELTRTHQLSELAVEVKQRQGDGGQGDSNRLKSHSEQSNTQNNRSQSNSGLNALKQSRITSKITQLQNFPVYNTWSQALGNTPLKPTEQFSRLNHFPRQRRFPIELEVPNAVENPSRSPLERRGILTFGANYGTYKFNAKTLESNIQVLHLKPQIYWPITSKTSLYSHYQLGFYNDSNLEHQTFSRLERKLGNAYIAANLFTWNYRSDQELRKGYFSPRQFLAYSGEIGWNQSLGRDISCQISVALGQQSLNAQSTQTTQYRARCNLKVTPNTMLDLGYSLSHENHVSYQNVNSILSQTPSFNIQFKMDF